MSLERSGYSALTTSIFFESFEEYEVLLAESDRVMELIVIVVYLCVRGSRASHS